MLPICHIYGYLWTVLLAEQLRVENIAIRHWSLTQLQNTLREGDMLLGHSGYWPRLQAFAWPAGVRAVHSGGPAPHSIPSALVRNGLSSWVDVYGCTELAGIAARESENEPYELFPYWPDRLKGCKAPDHLDWVDARRFHLAGRKDDLVQVSGMNVSLTHVQQVLAGCPGVTAVSVRLMRPEEGCRLKALVVAAATELELDAWAAKHLASWERPAQWSFTGRLPKTARGKIADW